MDRHIRIIIRTACDFPLDFASVVLTISLFPPQNYHLQY